MWYDKEGNLVTDHDWIERHLRDYDYKVVKKTIVDGKEVSTVWLGLDHNYTSGVGPPLIFETMVFPGDSMMEDYCERYSTEQEALAGHERIVKCLLKGKDLYEEELEGSD